MYPIRGIVVTKESLLAKFEAFECKALAKDINGISFHDMCEYVKLHETQLKEVVPMYDERVSAMADKLAELLEETMTTVKSKSDGCGRCAKCLRINDLELRIAGSVSN